MTLPRSDERIGLALAIAAHVALVAVLVLQPSKPSLIPPPERMTVTLSDNVGLTSTSPQPSAQAAPDQAPTLGEAPPPPAPEPVVQPETQPPSPPQPVASPSPPPPKPVERAPAARPTPQPVVRPAPRPAPKPVARPQPQPAAKPTARPAAKPAAKPTAKPAPAKPAGAAPHARSSAPAKPSGGSRIGADFLKGVPGATSKGKSDTPPAAKAGPAVQSALSSSIARQLKPHWVAPQGVDADKLVTILSWNLNRNGTLAGEPQVVRQEGITDSNKAQAARHAEQAIRAVRLAAPFDLPDQYYDAWKRVASFRFDRRLSQ